MGPPPTHSPVTGNPVPPHYIHSSSPHFTLTDGRTLLLRGINLASSAKTPRGQPGAQLEGFWEHAIDGKMSFVGRVLELDEADEHLERLKGWGFNSLRYVVTWESIEHEGPGKYDQEYLDYTVKLLRKCKEHGFLVYIDPHQDLWSRFSGGSGAPYWTLLACGLNPQSFTQTGSAYIESEWPSPSSPNPSSYPAMIWATNYSRLACQTLFTLWFAGRDYAPKCIIDGVNIQDYLEQHFFDAMRQLGKAIAEAGDLLDECVIGWDSLNEPNAGYLSIPDLSQHGKESVLRVGPMPTAFQAMRMGMGSAVEVENWKFGPLGPKRDGSVTIDPKGVRAWLDPEVEREGSRYGWKRGKDWELGTCIWGLHGVWDVETDELLQPDYFDFYRGASSPSPSSAADGPLPLRKVDFGADYWLPHWRRYAPVVRSFHPEAIHFIQSPVFQVPPKIEGPEIQGRAAHSSHFYDGLTLVTKHWNWFNADALGILRGHYASVLLGVKVGESAIRRCMRDQLGMLRSDGLTALGQFPTIMGEIGIPFDLDKKKAYVDGDYSGHIRALDASLNACDGGNMLNYSIWTKDDRERMLDYRTTTSQNDLVGKISNNRSRANSKASSLNSSTYPSRDSSALKLNSLPSASPSSTSLAPTTCDSPTSTTLSEANASLKPQRPAYLSTTSSATLGASSSISNSTSYQPINLNDGSRAIAAFCRPYPTKTVGIPLDINFDIRSSKFTLTIKVEAGDVADSELPTEIYVPLIHYAAFPSRVSQVISDDLREEEEQEEQEEDGGPAFPSASASASDDKGGDIRLDLPNEALEEDPRALALDVKVSTGRWETEGQTLRWFYPRPSSGSVTVKIELQRTHGAIPTW
ncbi:glycoside hydrolase superfamily [Leucosporidium creatinivorum]|uniref:Glycoside hydrolase superfamily n=1 Tax=Leucosporidium creatinivorum TaxID=106004 RepID=A0A1Y2EL12_9BASI|nr:glycoside hydrolase superfamily [Leucosporidium creatinivorum]